MTITYECFDSLYVNITNKCSNRCTFCVRDKHDSVNEGGNLWLEREPSVEEIKADFLSRDLKKYKEIVFCGYGEPFERFDDVIAVSKWLKENNEGIKIRVNTNGQGSLIAGRDITPEMKGLIDTVSISLNAENAEKYQKLCRSEFGGGEAYEGILEFARRAKSFVPNVIFTVVDIMPPDEIEACRKIAEDCGVGFRVREFIK